MKKIIIEGDFILKGDIPYLDKLANRFKWAEIEILDGYPIRLSQFSQFQGIKNDERPKKRN